MTQEQKDTILKGARFEIMNKCINYVTGVVDVGKMAEGMERYAEMYHQNELSKLSQHDVVGKSKQLVCDVCNEDGWISENKGDIIEHRLCKCDKAN